jgi:hypothetical protein
VSVCTGGDRVFWFTAAIAAPVGWQEAVSRGRSDGFWQVVQQLAGDSSARTLHCGRQHLDGLLLGEGQPGKVAGGRGRAVRPARQNAEGRDSCVLPSERVSWVVM